MAGKLYRAWRRGLWVLWLAWTLLGPLGWPWVLLTVTTCAVLAVEGGAAVVRSIRSGRFRDAVREAASGQAHAEAAPACQHGQAVEVRRLAVPAVDVKDDVVAWYCPDCTEQLPPDWKRRKLVADYLAARDKGQAVVLDGLKLPAHDHLH